MEVNKSAITYPESEKRLSVWKAKNPKKVKEKEKEKMQQKNPNVIYKKVRKRKKSTKSSV